MDVVQESHMEIARSRAVCDICHTRCVLNNYAQNIDGSYRVSGVMQVCLSARYFCIFCG